jgi:flagellar hook-associated protein 3 FlgL
LTEVGNDVFTPNLWTSLSNLDNALTLGPSGSPTYTTDLQGVLAGLDQGLATMLAAQASVGGRQQEISALQDLGESMSVQYASQMSNLVDLDFAKATSDFQMAMAALQTSQKTYAQIGKLSLFDHI